MMPTGSERAHNLDQLRAVAALAVLAGHAYNLGGRTLPVQGEQWSDLLLLQTVTGVWLFFAISGFVISRPFLRALVAGEPLPHLVPYAVRRVLRIYPVYWIALAVVLVVGGAIGPRRLLLHAALLHNLVPGRQVAVLSVAWTLTLEVLFYVTVPVVALLIRRWWGARPIRVEHLATGVLVTWLASIAWTLAAATISNAELSVWARVVFPAMWSSFCPGILLALLSLHHEGLRGGLGSLASLLARPARATAVMLPCLALGAWWGAKAPSLAGERSFVVPYDLARQLFAVGYGLLIGLAMRAAPWRGRVGQAFDRLGDMSYGIYLFHGVILYVLLSEQGGQVVPLAGGLAGYGLHLVLLLGLTLPVAWLSWHLVELPLLRVAGGFSQRWAERRRPASGEVRTPAGVAAGRPE